MLRFFRNIGQVEILFFAVKSVDFYEVLVCFQTAVCAAPFLHIQIRGHRHQFVKIDGAQAILVAFDSLEQGPNSLGVPFDFNNICYMVRHDMTSSKFL